MRRNGIAHVLRRSAAQRTGETSVPRSGLRMPDVTIHYFAGAQQRLGIARDSWSLPERTEVAAILAAVAERHPALRELIASCRVAHQLEFVDAAVVLRDGDELAVIPPVSGG
jgi:molybdopterin synthase catalytic subunit